MNTFSVVAIGLLTIVFTVVPRIGIPKSLGTLRIIEIPHVVVSFVLALLTVKGYSTSNTLLMVIPPLLVLTATGYAAWACRRLKTGEDKGARPSDRRSKS